MSRKHLGQRFRDMRSAIERRARASAAVPIGSASNFGAALKPDFDASRHMITRLASAAGVRMPCASHHSRFRRYSAFLSPRYQLLALAPPRKNRYYRPPIREVGLAVRSKRKRLRTPETPSTRDQAAGSKEDPKRGRGDPNRAIARGFLTVSPWRRRSRDFRIRAAAADGADTAKARFIGKSPLSAHIA